MEKDNMKNEQQCAIHDVSDCALSIRKTLKHLQKEMKEYKDNEEYSDYLYEAFKKLTSAMLYAQEIRDKLKTRQHYRYRSVVWQVADLKELTC